LAAVRQPCELIGLGSSNGFLVGLSQGLLISLQGSDIGFDRQNPAIWQDRVIDPEPAPINQIGLE
jgi:hypothetical protein